MAFYTSSFYGETYHDDYDYEYSTAGFRSSPSQPSESYPSYDISSQNFYGYDSTPYDSSTAYYGVHNHYYPTQSLVSYSAYSPCEPKYLEYKVPLYGNYDYISSTQFMVSHSVSEFNEIEFEEYDSTPYGGGYDQTLTYGKPLPPSEEICYPPTKIDLNPSHLAGVSYSSIPSPYLEQQIDEVAEKSTTLAKPTYPSVLSPIPEEQSSIDSEDEIIDDGSSSNSSSSSSRDEALENSFESPQREELVVNDSHGYGHDDAECGKPVSQLPYGCGLEAMDVCESLFGYWPCLARAKRNGEYHYGCDEGNNNNENQWTVTADYLFGSSNPYDDRRDISEYQAIIGYPRYQVRCHE